jgi:phosphoserine phosphatase
VPLCVDLDGTLIKEETHRVLAHTLFRQSKSRWLWSLMLFLWRGRLAFKQSVARQNLESVLCVTLQPFLVRWLHDQKAKGRPLVLVTGAPERVAQHVVKMPFLKGLFDRVITSDKTTNCVGKVKAAVLAQQFGARGFDYVGNSWQDRPVWQMARKAYAVTARPKLIRWLNKNVPAADIEKEGFFGNVATCVRQNWKQG